MEKESEIAIYLDEIAISIGGKILNPLLEQINKILIEMGKKPINGYNIEDLEKLLLELLKNPKRNAEFIEKVQRAIRILGIYNNIRKEVGLFKNLKEKIKEQNNLPPKKNKMLMK